MKVVIAGASGFLGTSLRGRLSTEGHQVTQLVRKEPDRPDQVRWDPYADSVDLELLSTADVVVNVAGAPVAHWPWTTSYRRQLRDSRVETTATLARAIARLDDRPALVNTSAIGFYGDRGPAFLDEDSPSGDGFLADVVRRWEEATSPAIASGARVVVFRPGIVLHRSGGVLKLMRWPFLLGVGGRISSGQQFFPTVSLEDYLRAVTRFIEDDTMSGTYNLVAPHPATNLEFTREMGARLHRPTFLVVPAFAVKLLGEDPAREALGSINAFPRRLLDAGFEFDHPTVRDQIEAAFSTD